MRVEIHPEPTDEELAAVVAAVTSTLATSPVSADTEIVKNQWREAGKRDARRSTTWEKKL